MSSDVRSRAGDALNVAVDVSPEAAAAAFLKTLPAANFIPSSSSVAAINLFAGRALPVDPDSDGFAEEVEEFACRYWSLEPVDRLAAWTTLNERSPDERSSARLLGLQGGLDVPTAPIPDPVAEEVAAIARELYVLPPRQRAIRRGEWLLANAARHGNLIRAVAAIQKQQPALAALDPVLFERLSQQFEAVVFAQAAMATPLAEPPRSLSPVGEVRRTGAAGSTTGDSEETSFQGKQLFWGALILGILIARVFGAFASFTSSSLPPPPPWRAEPGEVKPLWESEKTKQVSPPGGTTTPNAVVYFSASEIDECLKYHLKELQLAPPRYVEWIFAGEPKKAGTYPALASHFRQDGSGK